MTRHMGLYWFFTALVLSTILAKCPAGGGGDGIDDCSRRGRPQYRDAEGNWTCR